jgi:mono/diheme cytochrome c family protein
MTKSGFVPAVALVLTICVASTAEAQCSSAIEEGKVLFEGLCARCHGIGHRVARVPTWIARGTRKCSAPRFEMGFRTAGCPGSGA